MLTLQVIWKQLFAPSSRDHGTLSQFCSLLGRLPAAKDPKKDMNACTDILMTVLKGHYIAAASNMLGISSLEEIPKSLPDFKKASVAEKKAFLYDLADRVVKCCSVVVLLKGNTRCWRWCLQLCTSVVSLCIIGTRISGQLGRGRWRTDYSVLESVPAALLYRWQNKVLLGGTSASVSVSISPSNNFTPTEMELLY